MYRLELNDSPRCESARVEGINHIFLECSISALPNMNLVLNKINIKNIIAICNSWIIIK